MTPRPEPEPQRPPVMGLALIAIAAEVAGCILLWWALS